MISNNIPQSSEMPTPPGRFQTPVETHLRYDSPLPPLKQVLNFAVNNNMHTPPQMHPIDKNNLSLLIEASMAAAAADKLEEQKARRVSKPLLPHTPPLESENDIPISSVSSENRTFQIDRYISETILRVHSKPTTERKDELKPIDRRLKNLPASWSRCADVSNDPVLLDECYRLIRGTQGCGRDCDERFRNLLEFCQHIDSNHNRSFRPFLCPKARCPWSVVGFHERSECTRHIRTKHYSPMYTCSFPGCHKIYNRSDAFRRHVRKTHGTGSRVYDVSPVPKLISGYEPDRETDEES